MRTGPVRLNITLPENLVQELEKAAGPRKKSLFIAEAVKERLKRLEKEVLEKELEQGYRASREQGLDLATEFEACDLEGWDAY